MVNVRRVIHSPRLGCQTMTVYRSTASWQDGEFVVEEAEPISVRGIFTMHGNKRIEMKAEGDCETGDVSLLTTVPMYQTGAGRISDVVEWRGARFKVISVSTNVDYGFYRSSLTRMEGDDDAIA